MLGVIFINADVTKKFSSTCASSEFMQYLTLGTVQWNVEKLSQTGRITVVYIGKLKHNTKVKKQMRWLALGILYLLNV